MKKLFLAAVAMVVIIAVQMTLSFAFSYRVGEIFSRVSIGALFFYFLMDLGRVVRKKKIHAAE